MRNTAPAGNRKAEQADPFSSCYHGPYHALSVGWPTGNYMRVYIDLFHVHKDSTEVSATVSYQAGGKCKTCCLDKLLMDQKPRKGPSIHNRHQES